MFFVILIVIIAILSVVIPILIWGAIAYFAYKAIAKTVEEFQMMQPEEQLKTLMYFQKKGQTLKMHEYWNSLDSPVQMELGNMASSMGMDPSNFYR